MGTRERTRRNGRRETEPAEAVAEDRATLALRLAVQDPTRAGSAELLRVQNSYGNAAVQRLVAPTPVQRADDDDQKLAELEAAHAKAKKKARTARILDRIFTSPIRAIDQASVVDLHVKDAVNYLRTGKKLKERKSKSSTYNTEKGRRAFGRTGLRGYAAGIHSHRVLRGKNNQELPWRSKYNPLSAAGLATEKAKAAEQELRSHKNKMLTAKPYAPKLKIKGAAAANDDLAIPDSMPALPDLPDLDKDGVEQDDLKV